MSGVWVFRNGTVRLIEKPTKEQLEEQSPCAAREGKPSVLVHVPTGRRVQSHEELEHHLAELGWVRYDTGQRKELIQYHRGESSIDLISLPRRFSDVRSMHMYDIAVKNRSAFVVQERTSSHGVG
ncbi:flowering-promoting factor 1-like protein 2 [Typha latifolia]|uniref:flowering-promoting factor 1-like protein 2 n=1 Tax=Typha latifolia TaxID=4733 RepID=UPI003C2FF484